MWVPHLSMEGGCRIYLPLGNKLFMKFENRRSTKKQSATQARRGVGVAVGNNFFMKLKKGEIQKKVLPRQEGVWMPQLSMEGGR